MYDDSINPIYLLAHLKKKKTKEASPITLFLNVFPTLNNFLENQL